MDRDGAKGLRQRGHVRGRAPALAGSHLGRGVCARHILLGHCRDWRRSHPLIKMNSKYKLHLIGHEVNPFLFLSEKTTARHLACANHAEAPEFGRMPSAAAL